MVPASLIRRVEVSRGRFRNATGGALLGAGSAAGALLFMHFLIVKPLGAEGGEQVYWMVPLGAAVVGGIGGYAFPQERWQRQP